MKTKKWMLSVAMFAIAIVAAFAISSTAPAELHYRTNEASQFPCNDINVACEGENVQCKVQIAPGVSRDVWNDSACSEAEMNINSTPLDPIGE
tara:strand:+ start:3502 stop:3780 length:279 start_codon:yes stop_codon:yes gene_type:complete